jgi:hypothetical protein
LFGTAPCVFDKSLCLSAAEREEYEAFRLFRQTFFCIFFFGRSLFSLRLTARFIGEANYSKALARLARIFFPPSNNVASLAARPHFSPRFMQTVAIAWRPWPPLRKVASFQ